MSEFIPTELASPLEISHIVTLHDFNYTPDFLFTGETHDFWELAFIRRGTVGVMAGSIGYTLNAGEAIFHMPNEYHNICTMPEQKRHITFVQSGVIGLWEHFANTTIMSINTILFMQ